MFVNWEIRRESCLCLSFFSESETISCWWSGTGQIKIYFVAIPKYLQTLHQQKILKTFPLLQGQPGCLKGLPALFKLFTFASIKLYITLLFHSDILNVIKLKESVWKVQNLSSSSILQVEQQKLTVFFPPLKFIHASFCLLFMHLVDSFHDQSRVCWWEPSLVSKHA